MRRALFCALFSSLAVPALCQVLTGNTIELNHPTRGGNSDYTALYRADTQSDETRLRLMMGDEESSRFEIGYTYWQNGQWTTTFSLDGLGQGFFQNRLGIGIAVPEARLHVLNGGFRHGAPGEINIDAVGTVGGRFKILDNGNVGIGTTNPNQKLTVNGTIYGKEVKVDLQVPGPDYVFEKDYALLSLEEVQSYITENKHLPEIPSAKEMEQDGIKLSEMNMLLLEKIEELTLYVIDLKRANDVMKEEMLRQRITLDNLTNKE